MNILKDILVYCLYGWLSIFTMAIPCLFWCRCYDKFKEWRKKRNEQKQS